MNQDFNQTKVISGVMELFWNKGYEATTIEDILKVTQLNRKKFNEFFGSKEQLYLETFNYYSF
jgi:TetR/AcrR family transcriptional repressor of nem operon